MSISAPSFLSKFLADGEIAKLREAEALHEYSFGGITLVRLSRDHGRLPRGTVFHEHGLVPGYPGIMRILHLQNGINRYFPDIFFIEEKADGYNARIARVDGMPLAFTRGGFVCPFTTDRLPDLVNMDFFREFPRLVLCGEVVGPGNPYNNEEVPYIKEDVVFFAFDLLDKEGGRIPLRERSAALDRFAVRQVRRWGPFAASDIAAVRGIVLELDRNGREGIVIKPPGKGKPVKYVTLSSCLRDLQATAGIMTEIPAGFFIQRILRAVFFCNEFGIPMREEYLLNAARTLYLIPGQVLGEVAQGGSVRESYEIRVRNKETVDELLRHLSSTGIRATPVSVERDGNYFRARFYRTFPKGTKELRRRWAGKGFYD